jgi:hypothetical protein
MIGTDAMAWLEALSYVVTIVGLPMAIIVFVYEQRRERANEDEALYQSLADQYDSFLRLILEHADLGLTSRAGFARPPTEEERERRLLIYELLISIFERAYIMLYPPQSRQAERVWASWNDYMRYWCRREDLRDALPGLLEGEDDAFSRHIRAIAADEGGGPPR